MMQPRSKETKAQILASAYQLFSLSGYDATSVAEICQAAGVSKGAFYYHFPTKQAVFLELMESWLAGLDLALKRSIRDTQSVPEAIESMADTAAAILQSEKARLSIILEFWRQANRDPAIWQAASAPYERYHSYFSSLIQQGISDGSLDSVDPNLAARLLVSLALGLLMQALFDPQVVDWGSETQRSVHLLLDYLSSKKA
jgi:AcrR family transcriptional regulator